MPIKSRLETEHLKLDASIQCDPHAHLIGATIRHSISGLDESENQLTLLAPSTQPRLPVAI